MPKRRDAVCEYHCLITSSSFSHISFIHRIREKNLKVANDPATSEKAAKAAAARAVTITAEMVNAVVTALKAHDHTCVVMLTEADAQAAFMFQQKQAHLLITEDSDALLYGCAFVHYYFLLLFLFFSHYSTGVVQLHS